jgi:hypothetical protein
MFYVFSLRLASDVTSSEDRSFLLTLLSAVSRDRKLLQEVAMVSSLFPIPDVPEDRRLARSGSTCLAVRETTQRSDGMDPLWGQGLLLFGPMGVQRSRFRDLFILRVIVTVSIAQLKI